MTNSIDEFWREPDHFEGTSCGFRTFARRNHAKAWCGYVGVTRAHPLYEKDYNERVKVKDRGSVEIGNAGPISLLLEAMSEDDDCVSLDVLANVHGGITYAGRGWPVDDDRWYFGFDCNHYLDLSPKAALLPGSQWPREGTYRPLSYVKQHIEILASCLEKLS